MKILLAITVLCGLGASLSVWADESVLQMKGILSLQDSGDNDSLVDLKSILDAQDFELFKRGIRKIEVQAKSKEPSQIYLVLNENKFVDGDVIDTDPDKGWTEAGGSKLITLKADQTENVNSAYLLVTPRKSSALKDLKIHLGQANPVTVKTSPTEPLTQTVVQKPVIAPKPPGVTNPMPHAPPLQPTPQPQPIVPRKPVPRVIVPKPLPPSPIKQKNCMRNLRGIVLCEGDYVENTVGRPGQVLRVSQSRQRILVHFEGERGSVDRDAIHFVIEPDELDPRDN